MNKLTCVVFLIGVAAASFAAETWKMPAVQVSVGGEPVAVAAAGDGETALVRGNPKAARLSERTDRSVERFAAVGRKGLSLRVECAEGAGYAQYGLRIVNGGAAEVPVDEIVFFRDWAPTDVADGQILGDCDGAVAVFPGALAYAGVEHPLAQLSVADGRLTARLERGYAIKPGETWVFRWVIGRYVPGQLRRDFNAYLNAERAHPYRVFPHYNSWYDLNIDRNSGPWDTRMNEAQCLDRMRRFRKELGDRGVFINSYVWDDGWDDFDTLWDFHPGFPNGFRAIADEAHKTPGASIGCWMSPCGGYGSPQAKRLRYVQSLGIVATNETLLRMSSPKYYAAFRDRVLKMIRDYDMNMFKFDRMGGGRDGAGGRGAFAPEMEAIVRLVGEMRAAKSDVFVNATVGTWPSPFWLMYADSIWRGGEDFNRAGEGTSRQRWLTYRDNRVHDRFVVKNPLFPLNSVMLHGIIVTKYGPPKCEDVSDSAASSRDFADEVWMSVGCGTDLQEYYISPDEMHVGWWDVLAKGVRWLKENESVLADTHWIGGDPENGGKGEVYGYASWLEEKNGSRGVVVVRNPSASPATFKATLADLLELPASHRSDVVASMADAYAQGVRYGVPKGVDETMTFELAPFGVAVVNVELNGAADAVVPADRGKKAGEADDTWDWIDGSEIPMEGHAFADSLTPYSRLPASAKGKVVGGIWAMSRCSAGLQFRFTTDSRKLKFRWSLTSKTLSGWNLPTGGMSGIDVYSWSTQRPDGTKTDGEWWFRKAGPARRQETNEFEIAWRPGQPCLVNLPLYNGIAKFELGVEKGKGVKPLAVPHRSGVTKPVVFYGGSIVQGASASRPGTCWPNLVGRMIDVPIVNMGFNGQGKMEDVFVDYLASIDASCYAFMNFGNMGIELCEERYEKFLRALHAKRPGVPLVIGQHCYYLDARGPLHAFAPKLIERLKKEDPEFGKWLYLVRIEDMFASDSDGTVDGGHPNDWGSMHMAKAFSAVIAQALKLPK